MKLESDLKRMQFLKQLKYSVTVIADRGDKNAGGLLFKTYRERSGRVFDIRSKRQNCLIQVVTSVEKLENSPQIFVRMQITLRFVYFAKFFSPIVTCFVYSINGVRKSWQNF